MKRILRFCTFLICSGWRITSLLNSFSRVSQTKYAVLLPLQWSMNRVFAKRCGFEPSSFPCSNKSPAKSSFKAHCPDAPSCWLSHYRGQKHGPTLHFYYAWNGRASWHSTTRIPLPKRVLITHHERDGEPQEFQWIKVRKGSDCMPLRVTWSTSWAPAEIQHKIPYSLTYL